jgi:hypothetical protein
MDSILRKEVKAQVEKRIKDYAGLSLIISVISLVILICLMLSSITSEIKPVTTLSEIIHGLILLSYAIFIIAGCYFFISVMYYQFVDRRILLITVNILLISICLISYYNDNLDLSFIVILTAFLFSLIYYLRYTRPKLKREGHSEKLSKNLSTPSR